MSVHEVPETSLGVVAHAAGDQPAALADGRLAADPVITHEFAASDALEAFTVARDASRSSKVLLRL